MINKWIHYNLALLPDASAKMKPAPGEREARESKMLLAHIGKHCTCLFKALSPTVASFQSNPQDHSNQSILLRNLTWKMVMNHGLDVWHKHALRSAGGWCFWFHCDAHDCNAVLFSSLQSFAASLKFTTATSGTWLEMHANIHRRNFSPVMTLLDLHTGERWFVLITLERHAGGAAKPGKKPYLEGCLTLGVWWPSYGSYSWNEMVSANRSNFRSERWGRSGGCLAVVVREPWDTIKIYWRTIEQPFQVGLIPTFHWSLLSFSWKAIWTLS